MSTISWRTAAGSSPPIVSPAAPLSPFTTGPESFRDAMSRFATGVVVLSCEDEDGSVHGVTVSTFVSVSLAPPTVLVSLRVGRAHRLISRRGRYGASILRHSQQACSAHFAGQRPAAAPAEFGIRDRLPTLRDCLAWFECDVTQRVQIQDHTLFVAQVTACGTTQGRPLMYYDRRYHPGETQAGDGLVFAPHP